MILIGEGRTGRIASTQKEDTTVNRGEICKDREKTGVEIDIL